ITAKTRGTIKLGYIDKDFDSPAVKDRGNFSIEIQTQHNLNPKRALQVNGFRKYHESDLAGASSYMSTGIDVALLQRMTEKWSGTANVFLKNNDYNGIDRNDDLYGLGAAIRFEPKKWLIFDLGYYYYNNDSNVTTYKYEANQIFLRASISM
ncbi:MAG: outer membrane beta-barrel protein, partial [Desulfobacula sp.]|nr:outer membrane beta-barrel protein [Desulfobacula sp.]